MAGGGGGGGGGGNLRHQKEFSGKKMTNVKILEQFENSPDTGWEHFTGKNPDKTFLPITTKRGLGPLTYYSSVVF